MVARGPGQPPNHLEMSSALRRLHNAFKGKISGGQCYVRNDLNYLYNETATCGEIKAAWDERNTCKEPFCLHASTFSKRFLRKSTSV